VTIRHDGKHIHGEDAIFAGAGGARVQVLGLQFDLGEGCNPVPSRDGESILIRTPLRQTWRFRCSQLDTMIKEFISEASQGSLKSRHYQLFCTEKRDSARKDVVMHWDLELEGLT
jgi:uncharacterized heparinase superfamily protein